MLPRADVLILGGDLAYPNPSNETYETRLFRCILASLPLNTSQSACRRRCKGAQHFHQY